MRRALAIGLLAAALVPAAGAQDDLVGKGRDLYVARCSGCHGIDGVGQSPLGPRRNRFNGRGGGPPLRGVGAMAAHFYLQTGYMPLGNPYEQPRRGDPAYPPRQIDALVAYVASLGRGPKIPHPHPRHGSVSDGLRLFTENCAGCHQVAAQGGVVTNAVAPDLADATPTQIAEAIRIGPYLMPRFSPTQLSDRDVDSIVRYVQRAQHPLDRGGWGIGNIGPVPEGLVAWLLAGSALVLVARLIGERKHE